MNDMRTLVERLRFAASKGVDPELVARAEARKALRAARRSKPASHCKNPSKVSATRSAPHARGKDRRHPPLVA